MKRNILGIDLGTTSIGFAQIIEGETPDQSEIIQIGTRVNPLTTDEQTNFEKGKPVSVNADRTLKRGARRNLDRYQLRRENLIDALLKAGIITKETVLAEDGKHTTHETWRLRAKAVTEKIEKEELARVFLTINKKRGYKSSRKAKNDDEGQIVDGMAIAKRLYEENLTPGQLAFQLIWEGKRMLPDFYRSDLQSEFEKVWYKQKEFYPEIFTDEFYNNLKGKGQRATSAAFWGTYGFDTADIKDLEDGLKNERTIKLNNRDKKKLQAYKWRSDAITKQLSKEEVAYVITEINNDLNRSSGYLGAISDRSKELYFNKQTVGQYLYAQLKTNPHTRLKNQVFYRQDYLDEFEAIWTEQSKHHLELTNELKEEIRDIIIFYQRKLKSQKGLVSFCEFESKEVDVSTDSTSKKKTIGAKVAPKSSPLFQEFKIWQILHNVLIRKKGSKNRVAKKTDQPQLFEEEKEIVFDNDAKELLFEELNIKGNLSASRIIEILGHKPSEWELNYTQLEGNRTNQVLYNAFLKILEIEGYDEDLLKLSDKDDINVAELKTPASEIKQMVKAIFEVLGIDTEILEFNAELEGKAFEQQKSYQLWHLLYAAEDDNKKYSEEDIFTYGQDNIGLKKQLCQKFGFKPEHAKILANVVFQDDYGNLSSKAMRRIYPYIKENQYSTACEYTASDYKKLSQKEGDKYDLLAKKYRHSNWVNKDENQKRELKYTLDSIPKNSLRNPVVEKILNQMVNVVNALLEKNRKTNPDFKFDEIRIELARELKKNAKEREEMTTNINKAKTEHEKIVTILQSEFGVKNPTRNDIIRYKLYEELKNNGYKDLYTDTYIPREILFSKQIDIDHIIPQAKLFDDSFSNKTLTYRQTNLDKGNKTAYDYILSKFGEEGLEKYLSRVEMLFEHGKKSKEEGISNAKYKKLLKKESEIGDGFIERDLRDSQYIAKKAKNILYGITRSVVSTSGSITDRLREDWGLINIMKELNLPKYRALGLTEMEERKYGQQVEVIKDWTKRNDHRHHAMDALVIAFTKHNYIQYLNYLNARRNESHKLHGNIIAIETKETEMKIDDNGDKKRVFKLPIPNFREQAKAHLESVLVSHKAKNKVVTKNKNKTKSKSGEKTKTELTPRGQLHKETVYGKYHYYENKEEKIGTKFDEATIRKVSNPTFRKLLLERLQANGNDPKKAFGGKNALSKNLIYLNDEKTEVLPEKVKLTWLVADYSIRKDVNADLFKDSKKKDIFEKALSNKSSMTDEEIFKLCENAINFILDKSVRKAIVERYLQTKNEVEEYNKLVEKKEQKKVLETAFSNLETNPIVNKNGLIIKRVTISGVKNAEPLHYQKDHKGNYILDENGEKIPVDFVSTGNNHHVAIYRDAEGNLQDRVITLMEAVLRKNYALPIIFKNPMNDIDLVLRKGVKHDLILNNLPEKDWEFLFTMKQNEMFVFPNEKTGFNPLKIDLLDPKNKKVISENLFKVQTMSKVSYGTVIVRDYLFRHHLDASKASELKKTLQGISYHQYKSLPPLKNIIKVRINHLGDIVSVGEY